MFVGLAMIGVWDGGPEGWLLGRWGVCSAGRRCWEEVWAGWIGGLGLNYCVSTAICAICILTGTGASRRMACVEVVVP